MMFEGNQDGNLRKNGKCHAGINVCSEISGKNNEELIKMLGLEEILDKMAKINGVLWHGQVVRRDDDNVLKKALMLEVNGQRNRGRPKQIWRSKLKRI